MRQKKQVDRNYKIFSEHNNIKGSNYIEIATGRYFENKINEGSIFINVDSFLVIVGIIKKHYTKYDNYEMKNISRTTGMKIIINFREAAEKILLCKGEDILKALEYKIDKSPNTINDFVKSKSLISNMLIKMADSIENAYDNNDWICISEV